MNVKSVLYNWHQVGSINDKDGCSESFSKYEVGRRNVISVKEEKYGNDRYSYVIHLENGKSFRIFNANFVEYFKN